MNVTIVAGVCLSIFLFVILLDRSQRLAAKLCLFVIGLIFGSGLMISGMTRRAKIYGFLEFTKSWDPSLLIVLMTGVLFNIVTFSLIRLKLYTILDTEKLQCSERRSTTQRER